MSGGGGKGGSQTSSAEIPKWAEDAMKQNLARAQEAGQVGYMPYYGPDVAAFTPMQEAGMQSSYDAAAAYGLAPQGGNAMAGMPQAQTFEGGIRGYSSGDLFEQARREFEARNPSQATAYNELFTPYGNAETNPAYQPNNMGIPYTDPQTGETTYITFPWGPSAIPMGGF